jgi:hypothetical protein
LIRIRIRIRRRVKRWADGGGGLEFLGLTSKVGGYFVDGHCSWGMPLAERGERNKKRRTDLGGLERFGLVRGRSVPKI